MGKEWDSFRQKGYLTSHTVVLDLPRVIAELRRDHVIAVCPPSPHDAGVMLSSMWADPVNDAQPLAIFLSIGRLPHWRFMSRACLKQVNEIKYEDLEE